MPVIETVTLGEGARCSRIIRGGWQVHAATRFDAVEEAARIRRFMAAGVTTFETADTYRHVDEALALVRAGGDAPRIHARLSLPCDVAEGLAALRRRLGARPDLVQLQMWNLDQGQLAEAALWLAEHATVGLMNIGEDALAHVMRRGVAPVSVQVQLSLLDRRPLGRLARAARDAGVALLAYGTLAGGFLDEAWCGVPDPGPRAVAGGPPFHAEYRAVIEAFGGWTLFQELLHTLDAVARRHGVGIPAVATRWVLDQPGVAAALVGARDPARVGEWATIFALALTAADLAAIDAVLARSRGPAGPPGGLERDPGSPLARAIAASRG